jgi:hypothetical protein
MRVEHRFRITFKFVCLHSNFVPGLAFVFEKSFTFIQANANVDLIP